MTRGLADRPADFSSVVSEHWPDSTAYLQASREPCITIRDDEVEKIGGNRNLVALEPGDFDAIDRSRIWVLGVIVCPGDDIDAIVQWVRSERIDADHVWFFLHDDTDMAVLEPWAAAGHPTAQVDFVSDRSDLHRVFGLYLSDHIYEAKGPDHQTWTPGRRPRR